MIDYYRRHNDVNYTDRYNAGRSRALDSTQIKQLDQTIRQNPAATAAELLSLTHFNTTEITRRNYRLSFGYCPRKSIAHQHTNINNYIF